MKSSGWIGLAPSREATRPQYGQNSKVSSRIAASALLHRDLDVLAVAASRRARRARASDAMAAFSAGLEAGLLAERLERRQLRMRRVAVQRGDAAGAPEDQVGGA